ncbi:MAG: hypothetical protein WEG56_07915 [Chloroflexota bacterium]
MTSEAEAETDIRTLADPLQESLRIVDAAEARGLRVRLIGGMAVRAHAPGWTARTRRTEVDLDFVAASRDRASLYAMLEEEGYTPDRRHNALFRHQGYFVDAPRNRPVDVLFDRLDMCHRIEFADRLAAASPTLPLAELLLSKLQVVKINRKDILDAMILLAEHPLGPDDGAPDARHGLAMFNVPRIVALTSSDWGWWRTVTGNLEKLASYLATEHTPEDVDLDNGRSVLFDPATQVAALQTAIAEAPKSTRWRLRARIGERQPWYREPEEMGHD